jgi:hypothetical protein
VPFFVFGGIQMVCATVAILGLIWHTRVQSGSGTVALSAIAVVPNERAQAERQRSPYAVLRVPALWLVMMASLCTNFAVAVVDVGLGEFLRKAKYDWPLEVLPFACARFFSFAAMFPLVWLDQRAKVRLYDIYAYVFIDL